MTDRKEQTKDCEGKFSIKYTTDNISTSYIDDIYQIAIQNGANGGKVLGAGGGGFLQVVLKPGVSKETVRKTLKSVFQDSDVDVWDCEII